MKTILYITSIMLVLSMVGCKKNTDVVAYEAEKSAIYFGYAFPVLNGNISTTKGIDSIDFSFTTIDIQANKHIIKVPVHISGVSSIADRPYQYTIADEGTTMDRNNFKIIRSVIEKGKYIDSLEIEVLKTEDLKSAIKKITVQLEENENFTQGYINNQRIKVNVSNILLPPSWWKTWESVFGKYSQEKYQVWAQIYHEKADGYLNYLYNYKNMPGIANRAFYPRTFVFIQQLQQYFKDNIVYEGGDPKNPRITIPFQF